MDIKEVYKPIEKELFLVQKRLGEIKTYDNKTLASILKYFHNQDGKLIRPALFFLSGTENIREIDLALSIELIHIASLLHDDIIDEADTRRGKETINKKWGKNWAVLVGDLFLAKAFNTLVEYRNKRLIEIFTKGCLIMCQGQMLELEGGIDIIDEERYFRTIYQKTAHLFELSCLSGAIVGKEDEKRLSAYGRYLGFSFQITDDILDIKGDGKKKPKFLDIKNKKLTLPLIYVLKNASPKEKAYIYNLIKNLDISSIKEIMNKYGAIEYARNAAKNYCDAAMDAISSLKSPYKNSLIELAFFVLERKN
ncbi:TPA: hypothetical protein DCX16_04345 [bacterium]|nr:hypothetical protein [bacterium]